MIAVTGIRLTNIRTFEAETFVPLSDGLTVIMGLNNAGKSTVLRAPLLFSLGGEVPTKTYCRAGAPFGEVALRVRVAPGDFETSFHVALQRVDDVQVAGPGGPRSITTHTAFSEW